MPDLTEAERQMAFRFVHVALPSDAIDCDPWERHGDDDYRRYFLTREWDVAGIWVSVAGEQNHRGETTRWMHVGGEDLCSTSDRQKLISALMDAGRLLDSLNSGGAIEPNTTSELRIDW